MSAGRKPKYNSEIHKQLVDLIATGNTIRDACAYVGIHEDTFHLWLRTNKYSDFSEDIRRAKGQAHIGAVFAIRSAIQGQEQVTTTNDVVVETRLRKIKQPDGTVEEVPYDYTKTVRGTTVTKLPPDWRASIDYLKRRDPEHWSDRSSLKFETWETELVQLLRAGKITPEQVTKELETSLAERLFIAAGIPATTSS
jgi:hypothetical protein